jgi:hypothetical protein
MKKSLLVSLFSMALICMFAVPSAFAVDAPAEDMLLKAPEGADAKKNPVNFSHVKHAEFECQDCHHTWDGASPIKKCTESGCHDIVAAKGAEKKNVKYFETAFHNTCYKGCHKDLKMAGKPTGPMSCTQCHPK